MNVSYEEVGHLSVTLPKGNCTVGSPCNVNISGYAANCAAGEKMFGVVEHERANVVAVQVAGFVKLPYTGTKPNCGYVKLSGNGSGGLKADENGLGYWVLQVDSDKKELTLKL